MPTKRRRVVEKDPASSSNDEGTSKVKRSSKSKHISEEIKVDDVFKASVRKLRSSGKVKEEAEEGCCTTGKDTNATSQEENVGFVKKEIIKSSKTVRKTIAKGKIELLHAIDSQNLKEDSDNKAALAIVPRYLKSKKYVGAHTSIAGGLYKAIEEAEEIGAVSIGMFLRNQRSWKVKELDENSIISFRKKLESSGILPNMIIPHGSYLLNCGSVNEEILKKSRDCLVDELKRCELLGIPMYNFHPGSAKDSTAEKCMELIAETINLAHAQTSTVITLIENMSNQGNTVGGDFSQLKSIIDRVKDKSRVGVCFDTCHAFAAGYDLKSEKGYEETKQEFERVVGRQYLKAVHLNDSKGKLGCHLDRHENIGKGELGIDFFARLMNDPFFDDVPLVLETPECDYRAEIDLLYSLCL